MIYCEFKPNREMAIKDFDRSPEEFMEFMRGEIGENIQICRPFKQTPHICIAIHKEHNKGGMPATRALKRSNGKYGLLCGTFIVFSVSDIGDMQDVTPRERYGMMQIFMRPEAVAEELTA